MRNYATGVIAALISAGLLTAASPGIGYGMLAFAAFIPMVAMFEGKSAKYCSIISFVFGFSYFMMNIGWVVISVSVFGHAPVIAGVFLLIIFSGALGLLWILFGYIYANKGGVLLPSLIVVVIEVIKGKVLTGFPWLNLAQTQYEIPFTLQTVAFMGEYGLSFFIMIINLALYQAVVKRRYGYISALVIVPLFMVSFYTLRVRADVADAPKALIIQPGYSQHDKWQTSERERIISDIGKMTDTAKGADADMYVLPETVYPVYTLEREDITDTLTELSRKAPVIAGSIRRATRDDTTKYFNSVFHINDGEIRIYDKRHLVPFGEYFPMGSLFQPINNYFYDGAEDYTAGRKPVVFDADGITVAPLLCYEGAFTELALAQVKKGADIFAILSNDSWFGSSRGRHQHLAVDVMRAVEFGRSVVRSTQSGISAVIYPDGRIPATLGIDKSGILEAKIPVNKGNTVFTVLNYSWLLLAVLLWAAGRLIRRR